MSYKDLETLSHDELIDLVLELQDENYDLFYKINNLETQRNNKITKDYNDYKSLIGGIIGGIVARSNARNIDVNIKEV